MSDKVAAIDFGSSKIRCLVAKRKEDSFEIVAKSIIDSAGFNNGSIINFLEASSSLNKVASNIESFINEKIDKFLFSIENKSVFVCNFSLIQTFTKNQINQKKILQDLVQQSFNEIQKFNLEKNLLHLFYCILDKKSSKIQSNISHSDSSYIQVTGILANNNSIDEFIDLKKDNFKEVKFIAPSVALLSCFLKKNSDENTIIIDIGKNKTTLTILQNSSLIAHSSIPIGSNHLTSDLSKVLKIDYDLAEKIKINHVIELEKKKQQPHQFIDSKFFKDGVTRKISKELVNEILFSRILEIMKLIYRLAQHLKPNLLNSKIYLAGGGSGLKGLEIIFKKYFGENVFKLSTILQNDPKFLDGLSSEYLISYGLLKSHFERPSNEVIASLQNNDGILSKFFKFFSR